MCKHRRTAVVSKKCKKSLRYFKKYKKIISPYISEKYESSLSWGIFSMSFRPILAKPWCYKNGAFKPVFLHENRQG